MTIILRHGYRTRGLILWLCLLSTLGACLGEQGDASDEAVEPELITQELSGLGQSFWLAPRGSLTTTIPICWEDGLSAQGAKARSIVESALNDSWVANANITFSWQGFCRDNSQAAEAVHIKEAKQTSSLLGTNVRGVTDGVKLKFGLKEVAAHCPDLDWETCVRHQAIHEFGHVLGFMHESERPDVDYNDCPNGIPSILQGTPDTLITSYDSGSILETSYCRTTDGNLSLSSRDKSGVAAIYGRGRVPALCQSLSTCLYVFADTFGQYALRSQSTSGYLRTTDTREVNTQTFIGIWERVRFQKVGTTVLGGRLNYGDVIAIRDRFNNFLSSNPEREVNTQPAPADWEEWRIVSLDGRTGPLLVNAPFRLDSVRWGRHLGVRNGDDVHMTSATSVSEWRILGPLAVY